MTGQDSKTQVPGFFNLLQQGYGCRIGRQRGNHRNRGFLRIRNYLVSVQKRGFFLLRLNLLARLHIPSPDTAKIATTRS
jgi:hypothetical protein